MVSLVTEGHITAMGERIVREYIMDNEGCHLDDINAYTHIGYDLIRFANSMIKSGEVVAIATGKGSRRHYVFKYIGLE